MVREPVRELLPFLVLYLTRRGYTPAQAGFSISAYGGGGLAAAAVGGHLADRVGRRGTIAASMPSSAVVMLALSRAPKPRADPRTDRARRPDIGGLPAGVDGASGRPRAGRPAGDRICGLPFAINLGFSAGPAVAGLLAERAFVLVFVGDAATSAVFGVMALLLLPAGHGPAPEEHSERPNRCARSSPTCLS